MAGANGLPRLFARLRQERPCPLAFAELPCGRTTADPAAVDAAARAARKPIYDGTLLPADQLTRAFMGRYGHLVCHEASVQSPLLLASS